MPSRKYHSPVYSPWYNIGDTRIANPNGGLAVENYIIALGGITQIMTNTSTTVSINANDVVIIDSSADNSVTTTTSADSTLVVGVALTSIATSSATGPIAIPGSVITVNAFDTIARGQVVSTSTQAGKVAGSDVLSGPVLGRALTANGAGASTITVYITGGI